MHLMRCLVTLSQLVLSAFLVFYLEFWSLWCFVVFVVVCEVVVCAFVSQNAPPPPFVGFSRVWVLGNCHYFIGGSHSLSEVGINFRHVGYKVAWGVTYFSLLKNIAFFMTSLFLPSLPPTCSRSPLDMCSVWYIWHGQGDDSACLPSWPSVHRDGQLHNVSSKKEVQRSQFTINRWL